MIGFGAEGKGCGSTPSPRQELSLSNCGMVVLFAVFGDRKGERDVLGWRGWEDELLVERYWVDRLWASKRRPQGPLGA